MNSFKDLPLGGIVYKVTYKGIRKCYVSYFEKHSGNPDCAVSFSNGDKIERLNLDSAAHKKNDNIYCASLDEAKKQLEDIILKKGEDLISDIQRKIFEFNSYAKELTDVLKHGNFALDEFIELQKDSLILSATRQGTE
jgi:hypothetical protein